MVNAPVLHRSYLMTPLEWKPSKGDDARLKMTTSWELVELERRPTGAGNKINNEVINTRQCLVNMAVLRFLVVNRHFNVVKLIFTAIYRSTT